MWRNLRNQLASVQTYPELSPDLSLRRQVNQELRSRPALPPEQWHHAHWVPPHRPVPLPQEFTMFLYRRLSDYSGLCFGRVYPSDRLCQDLKFPLVCWFDWSMTLCDDLFERYGVDLSETIDESQWNTVNDLFTSLHSQLQTLHGLP
ncbi:hypothetical protein XM38_049490 [Halomicronema hongdechloris C2206]|uniref:Uncharacterized protein n=1 Tax=Halomicronema hongdechloris C2206 TaxID=1641165 RepID=A0A1Z3HUM4_9CYAN|nr:hypothetical protein [Halomicronema hongdechloris]ASC73975.1 hypothetical protein XM38_049490 [Halomicronema hongdechloris C2206]